MSKMMIGFVAAVSLLTVAGCKKGKGGAAAEALAKMEGFSKSMCDCKDKACADKVNDDMAKWGQEMAKNAKPGDAEKPDPEMAKKSADVMTKYTECMTKMMMAGMGGSGSAEPVKKDEPAGSGSDAKKDEPAGSGSDAKKDAAPAGSGSGSDAKKDEPVKKDVPAKKDDKKPDDKKAGGW